MDKELEKAILAFENAARRITKHLPDHLQREKQPLCIAFPPAAVRPLSEHLDRWPYLSDSRKNKVACTIQLCDAMWWHRNVWMVTMSLEPLWEWYGTVPVIVVSETLAYQFGRQFELVEKGTGFRKVVNALRTRDAISAELRKQLCKLNAYKNKVHLGIRSGGGVNSGETIKYGNAVRTLHALEYSLREYWEKTD